MLRKAKAEPSLLELCRTSNIVRREAMVKTKEDPPMVVGGS